MSQIETVHARQILDSRGNPTVEVEIALRSGATGRAAVPSGASTGEFEATELRDGGDAYLGKGVTQAVSNVNGEIASAIGGDDVLDQRGLDRKLIELDGTPNKSRLGANAILGVSLAAAHAAAAEERQPLWRYLGGERAHVLPGADDERPQRRRPRGQLGGLPGVHDRARRARRRSARAADGHRGLPPPQEDAGTRAGCRPRCGDEGGFAPDLESNEAALKALVEGIEAAGLHAGRGRRHRAGPGDERDLLRRPATTSSTRAASSPPRRWPPTGPSCAGRYPIVSIEDGMDEEDWDGWKALTDQVGSTVQLVGDDLFVTNTERLKRGIDTGVANSILIKVNQIGTLTETLDAIKMAREAGYTAVMSHRSGETEDVTIADLAVATGCGQIKTGAPSRSDRVAKYNQLLRIEEQLGGDASYPGRSVFRS